MSSNLETRSLLDDWRNFDKGCFFDLGHPLLNRIAESFVKAAGVRKSSGFSTSFLSVSFVYCLRMQEMKGFLFGTGVQIGAIQAAARESCFIAVEGMHFLFNFISFVNWDPKLFGGRCCLVVLVQELNQVTHLISPVPRTRRTASLTSEVSMPAGETNRKSLEAMVKSTGKESLQWGLAAGLYSGLTYGLKEARGAHDWKNSAMAGAITGMALALTSEEASHEQVVQCAITGAAISTAANLLTGIF
ncbi:hypothetical protein SCA6_015712 [Theobroma cacao]